MRKGTLPAAQAMLGHSDIKMTMRYAHLSPEHLRKAVARLNGLAPAPTTAPASAQDLAASAQKQHKAGTIDRVSRVIT